MLYQLMFILLKGRLPDGCETYRKQVQGFQRTGVRINATESQLMTDLLHFLSSEMPMLLMMNKLFNTFLSAESISKK